MNTMEAEASIVASRAIDRARRPACQSGACEQGRKPCPSRQACQLPEYEDDDGLADMLAAGIVVVFAVICIVAVVAALIQPGTGT